MAIDFGRLTHFGRLLTRPVTLPTLLGRLLTRACRLQTHLGRLRNSSHGKLSIKYLTRSCLPQASVVFDRAG